MMLVDVMELNPWRPWSAQCCDSEDSIMEMFHLFCSLRFITWGSVVAAKIHVVEFMRST